MTFTLDVPGVIEEALAIVGTRARNAGPAELEEAARHGIALFNANRKKRAGATSPAQIAAVVLLSDAGWQSQRIDNVVGIHRSQVRLLMQCVEMRRARPEKASPRVGAL